ncbi:hypothetical protein HK104_005851 [Borealophlyctis nickersoniae]|nr:hypothetical protein HK104_005851 [Borealophlyctis nickersoniae]
MSNPVSSQPPLRFADYFFQVGLSPSAVLSEKRIVDEGEEGVGERANEHRDDGRQHSTNGLKVEDDGGEEGDLANGAVGGFERAASSPVMEGTNKAADQRQGKPKSAVMHPITYRYQPEVLCRYPTVDYTDGTKFPAYLAMFCFPNDLQLVHDETGPPPEKYHSFIITEETGAKCYGVTVTIYEGLQSNLASQVENMIQEWREQSLEALTELSPQAESDLEYIQHIRSQLALNQETLLRARLGLGDPRQPDLDPAEVLLDAEEKVSFFNDLLNPMKNTSLVDQDNVFVPRCIGVLSHWPWHDFLKDWLCEVVKVVRGDYEDAGDRRFGVVAPLERYVQNLIHEIPLPPPGKLELSVRLGHLNLFCSRPPINQISALQNFSLYPLFRSLSRSHIITLFELALAEKKIIFLSSHLGMLTLAAESICLLFFPMYWQHILIPVLPARLLSYLQAPMPYIIGAHREYFGQEQQDEFKPPDATLVDLDNNVVSLGSSPPPLPLRERKKLQSRLDKYGGGILNPSSATHWSPIADKRRSATEAMPGYGVPITTQYAMPLGKHAPRTAESQRAVQNGDEGRPPLARRAGAASDPPSGSASREFNNPSRSANTAGLLDKLNRSLAASLSVNTSVGSNLSLDVDSNTRYTGSSDAGGSASLGSGDTFASMTRAARSDYAGDDDSDFGNSREGKGRSSNASSRRHSTVTAPVVWDTDNDSSSTANSPEKATFPGGTATSALSALKIADDRGRKMNQSPSNASLSTTVASLSTTVTSYNSSLTPTSRGSTLPHPVRTRMRMSLSPSEPDIPRRGMNRFSMSAGSTASSATTSTSIFTAAQNNHYQDDAMWAGIPVRRKEGHVFRELSIHVVSPSDDSNILSDVLEGRRELVRPASAGRKLIGPRAAHYRNSWDGDRPGEEESGGLSSVTSELRSEGNNAQAKECSKGGDGVGTCALCRDDITVFPDAKYMRCEVCRMQIHVGCLLLTESRPCPAIFNERKVQQSFFKVFTSLLKNYRQFLIYPEKLKTAIGNAIMSPMSESSLRGLDLMQEDWFKKEEFLASCDKESRPFMSHLVETQAFAQFTLDRLERPETDPEVLFFDESIKEKRNRSKLRFSKETTPFLKEASYDVRLTLPTLEVNLEGLDMGKSYSSETFPSELDPALLLPPRPVQSLVTQSDQRMMRSHTNELVQRARMAASMKRKQDYSKWMKSKWRHFQKIGGGEVVSLGFLSDEQRRELFEERIREVSSVIDHYETAHLSSQTPEQVQAAVEDLHEQNLILMRTADEEQLVDSSDQDELQMVLSRLFRVITIYEDFRATLPPPSPKRVESYSAGSRADAEDREEDDDGGFLGKIAVGPSFGRVADWAASISPRDGDTERDDSDAVDLDGGGGGTRGSHAASLRPAPSITETDQGSSSLGLSLTKGSSEPLLGERSVAKAHSSPLLNVSTPSSHPSLLSPIPPSTNPTSPSPSPSRGLRRAITTKAPSTSSLGKPSSTSAQAGNSTSPNASLGAFRRARSSSEAVRVGRRKPLPEPPAVDSVERGRRRTNVEEEEERETRKGHGEDRERAGAGGVEPARVWSPSRKANASM